MRLSVLLTAAAACCACSSQPPLPTYNAVPDFALTERSGESVALADLKGQVWIADFIFTNCAGPCPRMSSHMAAVQRAAAELDQVRLVSVSVDPDRDTPEVMSEYAARYQADPDRWLFLTGDKQAIYDLILKGFLLAIDDGAVDRDGKPGPGIITHSTKFVLVDREGRIRGYYPGDEANVADQILPDVKRLLAEG